MTTDPWQHDRLQRKATGEHLIKLLASRYAARKALGGASYILNIDATWGQGKTFFLECLRADLQQRGHAVAYVNAWQDDHSDDPLVTVMSAIEETLSPFFRDNKLARQKFAKAKNALSVVATESVKQVSLHALKIFTGIAADKIVDKINEQNTLDHKLEVDSKELDKITDSIGQKLVDGLLPKRVADHQKAKKSAENFRKFASEAISHMFDNGMCDPMFVIVDELDRCRPLYAIKLLEELKHLFSIEGVIFIVATDSTQLAHSVKAVYGAEFEGRKYLRRFFDQTFVFPDADRTDFINSLLAKHGIAASNIFYPTGGKSYSVHFRTWADAFELSNRDIEQCMEMVAIFVGSWEHENVKIDPIYMLLLIWLFYAHGTVSRDLAPKLNNTATVLSKWRQELEVRRRGVGNTSMVDGDQLFAAALTVGQATMHGLDSIDGNIFAQMANQERITRFGHHDLGITPNARVTMSEYPSRVRNAGRILDIPQ